MSSPKTPEQLAQAIEDLVAAYVKQGREAAMRAVDRAFTGRGELRRPARGRREPRGNEAPKRRHRSVAELVEVTEKLNELVRAHPGESTARFAELMTVRVRDLERPMARLKAEGRVRSVGQCHATRYFPSVGSRSREG